VNAIVGLHLQNRESNGTSLVNSRYGERPTTCACEGRILVQQRLVAWTKIGEL